MTAPRQIQAGTTFFVTVRAVNRSFRFVPNELVRKSMNYAFKAVAEKFSNKLAMHEYEFLSNHYHLLGTDLDGCLPDFMRELNALFSRQLNSIRGISGTNIEKDYDLVIVDMKTGERALEHAVYILANAVEAHLVERTGHWRAPSSWDLEYGQEVTAERPTCGLWAGKQSHVRRAASRRSKRANYAGNSKLPTVARFTLVRPPIRLDLDDTQLRALIRGKVRAIEDKLIKDRKKQGRKVLGWAAVVRQHWMQMPARTEEYFSRRPTLSASDTETRVQAIARRKEFLRDYYAALERFRAGERVVFPLGTWLMKARFNVECGTCHRAAA